MTKYRSTDWFGKKDKMGFIYRSWMKNQGLPGATFDGRPVIGICNTWSELTPCNAHLRDIAESVRRGVLEAGGFPLEFPIMSLGETLLKPTAMLFRNLASMDAEESIRGNPLDGVVLLTGCDKTTPSTLMGAASVNLPTLIVSGTSVWKFADDRKTGKMSDADYLLAESCMSRSAGHCMTMGTASTMACMVESLGLTLPHNAAIPAVDSRRYALAHAAGRRIVEMVREDLRISHILTRHAFENAIVVNGAVGGSTNAVIHLLAIAGRIGVKVTLDDWDRLGRNVPTLVDLMPSGRFLMEDFYYAGGLPVVMRRLAEAGLLQTSIKTVSGNTVWENVRNAECYDSEVIRPLSKPLVRSGGVAVLRGNLAPDGAVVKPSAASPHLLKHTGKAIVFENIEHYHERINDPNLEADESSILVLKNCGPRGYPGMAEVGNMGLPPALLKRGITDMIRISDARMSGTAYGTVILHCAPEAAVGGPLALVQDGDTIEVDVENRILHLRVEEGELERRRRAWVAPELPSGGYQRLYCERVMQANLGADFDFLIGTRGHEVPRPSL